MQFVSVGELNTRTGRLRERLGRGDDLVVTSKGKPIAVMAGVNEESLEPTLAALRRSRAVAVVDGLRKAAISSGRDALSMKDIDAEIAKARAKRR